MARYQHFSILALVLTLALMASVSLAAQRYLRTEPVSGQPVVLDNSTALMWQGCAVGQTGSACTGAASTLAWKDALAYCQHLTWGGYDNWRLPNTRELLSITEDRRSSPAIDLLAFPGTPSAWFWTASSYAPDVSHAWYIFFGSGDVSSSNSYKTDSYHVRCARN